MCLTGLDDQRMRKIDMHRGVGRPSVQLEVQSAL